MTSVVWRENEGSDEAISLRWGDLELLLLGTASNGGRLLRLRNDMVSTRFHSSQ